MQDTCRVAHEQGLVELQGSPVRASSTDSAPPTPRVAVGSRDAPPARESSVARRNCDDKPAPRMRRLFTGPQVSTRVKTTRVAPEVLAPAPSRSSSPPSPGVLRTTRRWPGATLSRCHAPEIPSSMPTSGQTRDAGVLLRECLVALVCLRNALRNTLPDALRIAARRSDIRQAKQDFKERGCFLFRNNFGSDVKELTSSPQFGFG